MIGRRGRNRKRLLEFAKTVDWFTAKKVSIALGLSHKGANSCILTDYKRGFFTRYKRPVEGRGGRGREFVYRLVVDVDEMLKPALRIRTKRNRIKSLLNTLDGITRRRIELRP